MTQEEKISYMRIAVGICGYGFKNEQLDLLISIYELILEKKGETDIKDVLQTERDVKERKKERDKNNIEIA